MPLSVASVHGVVSAILLPEERNNVRWIYTKNGAETEGEDRGLVDNVELLTMEKFKEELKSAGNIEGFDFELDSPSSVLADESRRN